MRPLIAVDDVVVTLIHRVRDRRVCDRRSVARDTPDRRRSSRPFKELIDHEVLPLLTFAVEFVKTHRVSAVIVDSLVRTLLEELPSEGPLLASAIASRASLFIREKILRTLLERDEKISGALLFSCARAAAPRTLTPQELKRIRKISSGTHDDLREYFYTHHPGVAARDRL